MNRRRGPVARYFFKRPRSASIWLLSILLLFYLAAFVGQVQSASPWWFILITVVGCLSQIASLWWRNRYPGWVYAYVLTVDTLFFLAVLVFGTRDEGYTTFAGVVTLYFVTKWFTRRVALILLALSTLSGALSLMVLFPLTQGRIADFVAGCMIIICFNSIAFMLGVNAARERLHQQEVAAWAEAQNIAAQISERSRIARELHDVVAHSLTVMVTLADGARVVTAKDPQKGAEIMNEISTTGRSALADMRRVLGILKTQGEEEAPLSPLYGVESIRELVQGFKKAGMPVTFIQEGETIGGDQAFTQTIYRIIQESLTNALRYAKSSSDVSVLLRSTSQGIHVAIRDNGLSGAPSPSKPSIPGTGHGLQGLKARAEAFNGKFYAGPLDPYGWEVSVDFPQQRGMSITRRR